MIDRRHVFSLPLWFAGSAVLAQPAPGALADRLRAGRCAALWRHAETVRGTGDPPGFTLAQCNSQRNLSDEGRAQARAAGAWFEARKLAPVEVRSSAWCRCKDTADLAFGRHSLWTPLNSTFNGDGDEAAGKRDMLARLAQLARAPTGTFEVWVTHQVNITALTDEVPSMGEMIVVDAAGKVVARGTPG